MTGSTAATPTTTVPPVSAERFLEHVIDGLLLRDLETLVRTEAKERGGVGYPITMAVLSGCDLLGQLAGRRSGEVEAYFKTHMKSVNSLYAEVAKVAQDLCRNGIAHSFVTKTGVEIVRGEPCRHLKRAGAGATACLYLDCIELAKDFKESYVTYARPALLSNSATQSRVCAILLDFAKSQKAVARLPSSFPSTTPRMTPGSGTGDAQALPPVTVDG